jgi:hypothetical protein
MYPNDVPSVGVAQSLASASCEMEKLLALGEREGAVQHAIAAGQVVGFAE